MADDQAQQPAENQPQQPPTQQGLVAVDPQTLLRLEQQAYAQAVMQAEREQKDETVPGGRYRLASGLYVDAEGNKHKDQKSE